MGKDREGVFHPGKEDEEYKSKNKTFNEAFSKNSGIVEVLDIIVEEKR